MLHRNNDRGTPDAPASHPASSLEQKARAWVHDGMKTDLDVLVLATRLVDELGEAAVRISRVRLVELTAANHTRAAAFWRDVLRASERLLDERSGTRMPPSLAAAAWSGAVRVDRPIP